MNTSTNQHRLERSDANATIAWTEPKKRQKARRVKVWLTKSIHNLASPSAVDFANDDDFSRTATNSQRPLHQSFSNRSTSRKTTTTIDQAMFSLYTDVGPKKKVFSVLPVAPETPSSYVPARDYDWLLDGRSEWKKDEATSQEYLDFLNQPWDMEGYLENYLQEREETFQKELHEDEEAFQFEANFDENAFAAQHDNTTSSSSSNPPEEEKHEEDDDDFGDFQEAKTDNIFQTPQPTESVIEEENPSRDSVGLKLEDDLEQEVGAVDTERDDANDPKDAPEDKDEKSQKEPGDDLEEEVGAVDTESGDAADAANPPERASEEDEEKSEKEPILEDDLKQKVGAESDETAANPPDASEDEKSQEEVIVQEAVQILKSLPTPDFNKAFGAGNCSPVLDETCNLASELEKEQGKDDSIILEGTNPEETSNSPEQKPTTEAETAEEGSGEEVEPVSALTSNEAAGTEVTGQSASQSAMYTSQDGTVHSSSYPCTTEDATSNSQKDDNESGAASTEPLVDEGQSTARTTGETEDKANFSANDMCGNENDDDASFGSFDDAASNSLKDVNGQASTEPLVDEGPITIQNSPGAGEAEDRVNFKFNDISENAVQSDDDDDSFSDFQEVPAAADVSDPKSDNEQNNFLTPTPPLGSTATQSQEPPSVGVAFHTASTQGSSVRPTFAVLPPLKIDTAVKVQQEAEDSLRETARVEIQPQSPPRAEATLPTTLPTQSVIEDPFQSVSEFESEDDISADDSVASDEQEDIRISWRLPITDLSTPLSRFTRRQKQRYKEAAKTKRGDELPSESTTSLFSVLEKEYADDDEDGEPLLSLADLDLPTFYFTQQDFDDTTRVLQSAPWHHIAHMWDLPGDQNMGLRISSTYSFEDQQDRQALWDEYITQELCKLDTAQNQVAKHLLRRIQPHEGVLQKANQSIHEFATNLQLAQMYLKRSQGSVRQAARGNFDHSNKSFDEGCGWFGANALLQAWDKQEMYSNLDGILAKVQEIFQTEKSLQKRISEYTFEASNPREYHTMAQQVVQLNSDITSNDSLSRVAALSSLRLRLAQKRLLLDFHNRLHTLAESVGVRAVRRRPQGLSVEYKTLLEAAIEVDGFIRIKALAESTDEDDEIAKDNEAGEKEDGDAKIVTLPQSPLPALTKSWPQIILTALCYEADRAFATALLDPLVNPNSLSTDSIDSEFERELTQLACEIQRGWGDSAKLKTVTHNLVIIRFDWENLNRYFLPVYHRLCLALADVLYSHYLLGQWHERFVRELESQEVPMEGSKEEKKEVTEERMTSLEQGEGGIALAERRAIVDEIRFEWTKSQDILWKRCEDVLILCLDEYLHFASNQNFFSKEPQSSNQEEQCQGSKAPLSEESPWRNDLEELHSVLQLTREFSSVRLRFFEGRKTNTGDACSNGPSDELGADLKDKLCDVFRKHLRYVHVEAMKTTGASLSRDNWELIPLKQLSTFEKSAFETQSNNQTASLKELLVGALADSSENIDKGSIPDNSNHSRRNDEVQSTRSLFGHLPQSTPSSVNRFLSLDECNLQRRAEPKLGRPCVSFDETELRKEVEVYDLISSALAEGDEVTCFTRFASKSVAENFFPWIARLLLIMEKLPLIVEDVSVVFANLCDLYFTTVFRVCAGDAGSERILLGLDPPTPSVTNNDLNLPMSPPKPEKNPTSSPLFGFRRLSSSSLGSGRRKSQTLKVELPEMLEADLCAPLASEVSQLSLANEFIKRAQKTLSTIVLLDKVDHWVVDPAVVQASSGSILQGDDDNLVVKVIRNLEQRVGAAWSCLGVAAILDATCCLARIKLSDSPQALDDISTLEHYNQAALQILPQLMRVSSRISTVRAAMARRVVTEIIQVGSGWETDQMSELCNDYIDSLANRCSCIWAALSVSPQKHPIGLLRVTWKDLVEGCYASLLEGFSRVPMCSTEGRALMSMDLASFNACIHPSAVMERLEYQIEYEAPPKTESGNKMRYVDTYVKAFYYPKKDVMNWIMENHYSYHLNHFLKLTAYAYRGNDGEGATVEEALELVQKMFQSDEEKDS